MSRSTFMRVFIAGIGLTMLLSTAAFAEEVSVSPDSQVSSSVMADAAQAGSGTGTAAPGMAATAVDSMPASSPDPVNGEEGIMYATGVPTGEAEDAVAPAGEAKDAAASTDVKVVSAPADTQIYTATAVNTTAGKGTTLSAAAASAITAAVLVLLAGILYLARKVRTAKRQV